MPICLPNKLFSACLGGVQESLFSCMFTTPGIFNLTNMTGKEWYLLNSNKFCVGLNLFFV